MGSSLAKINKQDFTYPGIKICRFSNNKTFVSRKPIETIKSIFLITKKQPFKNKQDEKLCQCNFF